MKFPGSVHNHSEFSNIRLRDCIIKVENLIDTAVSLGHKVLAITDHDCLSGHLSALSYYEKIKKDNPDFKLILGNEIYLCRNELNQDNFISGEDSYYHFILLAKDKEGHKQLREISTRAWLRSYKTGKMRRVPTYYQDLIDIIDNNKGHLIASSACLGGFLSSECLKLAENPDEERRNHLIKWCKSMVKLFGEGNFYIELQPPEKKDNEQYLANQQLLEIAKELNIPWIVTTDSHYARLEDRPIHKAYLNSQDGEREVDAFYATTYMMTTEELESYFDFSLDEAYKNIDYIASQCEDYDLRKSLKIPQLPWKTFNPKSNLYDWVNDIPLLKEFIESDYIGDVELAKAIVERLEKDETLRNQKTYKAINDCLDKTWESSIVNKTHWSAYYLNLQKIIDCCWEAGSLVGPGRGSGVGFILLYLLDITQINPLRETVQTFSWRFLNPSRVSVLDVDVDIEGSKRAQVLSHLREVYGEDRVANVITFGKETSKSAILTACRGLGIDVDEAQYIASLIPADRGLIRTLSQCYYGDKENDYPIIRPFVDKMKEYPELWDVAHKIEGLICRSGIHAGGVIFVDEPFTESASLMRAPDGTIVTGYDLHRAEDVSLIKYDLLSVEAMDKMHNCLDLLLAANKIQDKGSLRETYEEILGVYNIERNDSEMWKMVNNHEIQSLFQMEKQSGIQGIALTHPKSVEDLAHLNSIIRLMAQEKGGEQPLNKYARFKANINLWYQEMENYGLTEQEQELLKPYLSGSYGICESQEGFMQLVQIPECGGFDLTFADSLRKAIAKKNPAAYDELTKKYFTEVKEKSLSQNLCNYVWNVLVATSRGYGFNLSHTLAYSIIAVQEMNLAFKFPIVYWNCACLINDAGGEDGSTDYNKIATALGKMQKANIKISLVDINNSQYNFVPDEKQNLIWMGLKSLLNVGDDLIKDIIAKRPYNSMIDFYNRVRPNKQAMITLIKGGAFDNLSPRYDTMITYLWLTCDKKSRLTLQNLPGLIRHKILPEETEEQITARKIYEFNRYLKNECKYDNEYYKLDERALNFIYEMDYGHWIENNYFLNKKIWDKNIYQTWMDIFRNWINQDKQNILNKLNTSIFMKDWEKYASGNLSSWEMEALCFYYHPHELINVNKNKYGIVDFEQLPIEPEVEKFFRKGAVQIPIYKLHKICGTCIAKNKPKGIVYLLTTTGVVPVKLRKEHFAIFDKQISERQSDGTKKVIEKSWFNRGNMILVQGIRRGDEFVSKKYASSISHQLYHIDNIDEHGDLILRHTRLQGDIEDEED